jgi:hypothetical protein
MSLKIKKSSGAGVHIDEGEYTAIIESIQLRKWEDGGESYAWSFKIKGATLDEDPIEGPVHVNSLATAILTPKSKLSKWAEGAGLDMDDDEVDLEKAIGRTVRVYVEDHETKEGTVVSKVTKVKPTKKAEGKKSKKDDDDDNNKSKKKKSKKDDDDDDDDDDNKSKKKKSKKDDDDDDDNKSKKKKSKKDDDDDDDALFGFEEEDDDD